MKLAELIDLEVQLRADEAARDGIAERDRAIGHRVAAELALAEDTVQARLASERPLRHAVLAAWLRHLPAAARAALPGERVVRGYAVVGWVLFAIFALSGIAAATAALSAGDARHVNALVFVVVFFALQIGLLLLYPLLMLLRRVRGADVLPWLQGLLVRLSRVALLDKLLGRSGDVPAVVGQLAARQTVYGSVQQWTLFAFVQRMATGFNGAALLASFYMVSFHDLQFGWSTTLDLPPERLHLGLTWLAAPWSFLGDLAVPSVDALRFSRYVPTLPNGFPPAQAGVDAEALRRTWWPFLVAGLVTWGLLPRALLWAIGCALAARSSARVPLDHMAVQHLFERLFPPAMSWQGPDPDAVRGHKPPPRPVRGAQPLPPAPSCSVVCWGTLAADPAAVGRHVQRRFGRAVERTLGAGLADPAVEEQTIATLARAQPKRVVLALPEGQQPTKDVMRFLAAVRGKLGASCELVVGILAETGGGGFGDVDADELAAWRDRLLAQGDPYLTLQTMGTTA